MSFNPHQWYLMGSPPREPNTFIGGVSSVITNKAALAAKLETYPSGASFPSSAIQKFTIVGDDIHCYIGLDYQIKNSAFLNTGITTSSPTYWRDYGGKCKALLDRSFYVSNRTAELYFPEVLSIGVSQFYHQNNVDADVADKILFFPKCTYIGVPTVADTQTFGNTVITQKYYASTFLQTNNAGSVDATLADGIANRGLQVVWVLNTTAPNAITDLAVGTVSGTAIQLTFTPPSSTNTIDFYEVYVDGIYYQNISASGDNIIGLNADTTYAITVRAVDIYYNKSGVSNKVIETTTL